MRRRPKKLPSWIEYYGRVSENAVTLYNAASVCPCSSAAEGFALPAAEAMACGCAVATTDCGGNREYAKDGETALVSDPDDFGSLVGNTFACCLMGLRMRIAFSGRERITQFTWEKKRAATARVRARLSLTAYNVTGSLVAERFASYHSSSVYQY